MGEVDHQIGWVRIKFGCDSLGGLRPQHVADCGTGTAMAIVSPADTYAGDLSPRQAWDMLARDQQATLIDVRSQAEWSFVGTPDLSSLGKRVVFVPWQDFVPGPKPAMAANANFMGALAASGVAKTAPLIFICRSGGRSKSAAMAMTKAGYKSCYNLAGGFEGPHDGAKHRGGVAGWKAAGLPWTQE
jgi:rhodanese-related sulfurtransferase